MCLESAAAPPCRRSVFGSRGRQETPNPLIPSVPFLSRCWMNTVTPRTPAWTTRAKTIGPDPPGQKNGQKNGQRNAQEWTGPGVVDLFHLRLAGAADGRGGRTRSVGSSLRPPL